MKRFILILLMLIINLSMIFSQEISVSGTVTDGNDKPLPGVNVVELGTTNGTITDLDGKYSIRVKAASSELVFSFVGYLDEKITVTSSSQIDIKLVENILQLDDVVVVGYGTAKKSDLTGSIVSVKPKELNLGGVSNAAQMLQGRITGLYVNSHDQNPGAKPEFILRGASSFQEGEAGQPLIVIDGFPMEEASSINTVNPNDIQQIDVLKDASATAIYGSRGANGVIIITTKQGNKQGIQIDYSTRFMTQSHAKSVDLMDGQQYARFYYDLAFDPNLQIGNWGPENGYPHPFSAWDTLANTDWQNEVINKGNLSQEHNLSVSGIREGVKYRAAINYFNGKGIISPTNYKRINTLAKLDYDYKKFSFNLDFNYTNENRNLVENSYERALGFSPSTPVYDENGDLSEHAFPSIRSWYYNPLFPSQAEEDFSETNTVRVSAGAQYEILDGLRVSVKGGLTQKTEESFYQRFQPFYESDQETEANLANDNYQQIYGDAVLNYTRQMGQHKLLLMAGGSVQSYRERGQWASSVDFPYTNIGYYNIDAGLLERRMSSYWYDKRVVSGLARLNYDYAGKYLVTVNYRLDGATVFGNNNKWGHFPSFGLAYRIDQEDYFRDNISFLSVLKLKAGYGIAGNSNIPGFRTQTLIDFRAVHEGGGITNAIQWANTDASSDPDADPNEANLFVANPDLHWESTYTLNLGIEFGNSNFYTEISYYKTNHDDLILDRQVPTETGFSYMTINKGSMVNRGLEGKLDFFLNFLNGDLKWKPGIVVSYNENEITDLDNDKILGFSVWIDRINYGYAGIKQKGYPLNAMWGYDFVGIWQEDEREEAAGYNAEPGDPKFADNNSVDEDGNIVSGPDGHITEEDKIYIGDANPKIIGGFSNQFNYKNFELNFFFEGVFKKTVVNVNKATLVYPSYNYGTNKMNMVLDRWTPTNPSNKVPSLTKDLPEEMVISNWAIEDASFIRLRDLTLAYNIYFKDVSVVKNLRIYASVTNLLTFSKYSGVNPDVWGTDNDQNLLPFTRTYTIGLNVSF